MAPDILDCQVLRSDWPSHEVIFGQCCPSFLNVFSFPDFHPIVLQSNGFFLSDLIFIEPQLINLDSILQVKGREIFASCLNVQSWVVMLPLTKHVSVNVSSPKNVNLKFSTR